MKHYFDMMWEDRPWWFNCFIAGPVALVLLAFLPFGYILCPPFRRYVDGICAALENDYARIHDAHKLDPVGVWGVCEKTGISDFLARGWLMRVAAVMTIGSAVAMGLIVCLHLPRPVDCWLCHCGVPWFFFASGFWFARENAVAGVRKRVRTLLVPYFAANLIWFPILLVSNWIGWKFCGAQLVVDWSFPCVVRCLGLSPFAWPALVPTWFLRALFVVVVVVGAARKLLGVGSLVALSFAAYLTQHFWGMEWPLANEFFTFGLSLSGCAWFALGLAVGGWVAAEASESGCGSHGVTALPKNSIPLLLIRHWLMPVYMLHAAVIVSVGWVAKASGWYVHLASPLGDVCMWFVGVGGAVLVGEGLRRYTPRLVKVLFGGR